MEKQTKEDIDVISNKFDNTFKIGKYPMVYVVSFNGPDAFAREIAVMELESLYGKSRGYLKYYARTK